MCICTKGGSDQKCECKIAHAFLETGKYLLQEGEVDFQKHFDQSDLKQQSLQALTKQPTTEELT